jgi:hypothetical protein
MSNFTASQGLTREEHVLHHCAAMVKDDLRAYHASESAVGSDIAWLALWEVTHLELAWYFFI